ncbi:hypothetical protein JCGZ_15227 [Jatropha curcas]|uniref:Uncharacterized protein n=1 Tax=Jatropha curcas TaxID=180498 RepID=A0A067K9L3_JATCU|nr:hypothetical protein JCGZ_15227 [Jatropha curcas]
MEEDIEYNGYMRGLCKEKGKGSHREGGLGGYKLARGKGVSRGGTHMGSNYRLTEGVESTMEAVHDDDIKGNNSRD